MLDFCVFLLGWFTLGFLLSTYLIGSLDNIFIGPLYSSNKEERRALRLYCILLGPLSPLILFFK